LQQQLLAIEGTGSRCALSAGLKALALAVVRAPWLLAGLLPVTYDGRKLAQVLADEGVRLLDK
jgi:hypothetical protein